MWPRQSGQAASPHRNIQLRIRFQALESALIDQPKRQDDVLNGALADRTIEVLKNNPKITQTKLASSLEILQRILQRKWMN